MNNLSSGNLKKVLIIAYGFPPIAYVGVYRTLRFCKYLPGKGWLPEVITIKGDGQIFNNYSLLKKIPEEIKIHRTNIIDVWRKIQYKRIRESDAKDADALQNPPQKKEGLEAVTEKVKNVVVSLILNIFSIPDHMLLWVPFATARGIKLMCKDNYDVIYTTSPPHSEHLVGLILSAVSKKPWIADCRDPISDNFSLRDLSRFHYLSNKYLEKIIIRYADKVIIASDLYSRKLKERYPAFSHKITVIMNGFDPELFEKVEASGFDKFTIIYTGSMYGTIRPDFFLKGLKKWVESKDTGVRSETQFLIHGWRNNRAELISKELGIEDIVKIHGYIPQEEIIQKQKGAHLLLLVIGFDERSKGVVTSKFFEYIATGRPIIAIIPEGEALDLIRNHKKYYHVLEDDYDSLLKALDTAYAEYSMSKLVPTGEMSNNHLHDSIFNAKNQVVDLVNIFNEALQLS